MKRQFYHSNGQNILYSPLKFKKIKTLSIGDHVPDFAFNLLNYSKPVANLSAFKGKLIILDFWATWCHPCLHAFPKLNKFQKELSGKLQLILVNSTYTTGDTKAKAAKVLKKYSAETPLSFLMSYDDSFAANLFPHQYLPHYVRITPNGIVKAITDNEDITAENIKAILQNENLDLSLPVKKDYFSNKLMDLSLKGQPEIDENLAYYSIFKKGKIDRLSTINAIREVPNAKGIGYINRGISLRNVSLVELFETATKYSKTRLDGVFSKRVILEIKDSTKFIFDSSKMTKETWEKNNNMILSFLKVR
jgi:thiol-disulfide isomerase/thioredoxin